MTYKVILSSLATKRFYALDRKVQVHLARRLDAASSNPMLFMKKLKGVRYFALRAGDYRAILDMDKKSGVMLVLDVGHRRDIYKRM